MTKKHRQAFVLVLLSFLLFDFLSGCRHAPVRHLSSDVCLLVPNMSTKQDVLSLVGQPDSRRTSPEGNEVWYYYQANKSTLRRTPYIGDKLGTENFDLVTVTFAGDRVLTCVFRELTQEEFEKTGIYESTEPPE